MRRLRSSSSVFLSRADRSRFLQRLSYAHLIHSVSLSTSSATLSITVALIEPVADSTPRRVALLLGEIERCIAQETTDQNGQWFASEEDQRRLKAAGWRRAWRVKEVGWQTEEGEKERERVLEKTFDFSGEDGLEAWKLTLKANTRLGDLYFDILRKNHLVSRLFHPCRLHRGFFPSFHLLLLTCPRSTRRAVRQLLLF